MHLHLFPKFIMFVFMLNFYHKSDPYLPAIHGQLNLGAEPIVKPRATTHHPQHHTTAGRLMRQERTLPILGLLFAV